ncbi:MAG: hypothetical protein IKX23_00505 [Treponema sp.]|nr:hypothetical protein [Treponema sp.]
MKKLVLLTGVVILILSACQNNPDKEKIVKERDTYIPMEGEIVLVPSKTIESQLTETGKTYVIRDGFNLNSKEISIPSGSRLKFLGGTIYNGTVSFNNTTITNVGSVTSPVFNNCSYKGSLANSEVELGWFDLEDGNTTLYYGTKYNTHDYTKLQAILNCCKSGAQLNVSQIYIIRKPVSISKKISIKGVDRSEGIYANRISQNMEYGFYQMMNQSAFIIKNGGDVSIQGISVVGNISLYIGGNLWEKYYGSGNGAPLSSPICICGIDVEQGGKISEIHDSSFVAFTYGIRCQGGSIGLIKNSYFSSNRFGFWAKDTSNFELRGCRLNTNLLNFHFYEKSLNDPDKDHTTATKETDAADIAKLGGGLYLNNCTNANIINCRFEFNFIHAILDNANSNINIHNAIFDTGTLAQLMINNQGSGSYSTSNPAFSNIKINSCTFARGARCDVQDAKSHAGFGIFYICDKGNRGSNVEITNNIISDNMEVDKTIDVVYENHVFDIYNTSSSGTNYTIKGNSFYNTEAQSIYNVINGSSGTFTISAAGNDYASVTKTTGTTSVLNLTE